MYLYIGLLRMDLTMRIFIHLFNFYHHPPLTSSKVALDIKPRLTTMGWLALCIKNVSSGELFISELLSFPL